MLNANISRLIVLFSILGWAVCQDPNAKSDVIELDATNFDSLVGAGGDWFIDWYSPKCRHCKDLEPTWNALATQLKGKVKVARIDATKMFSRGIASRFQLRGYPTLTLVHGGRTVHVYEGPRALDRLEAFALEGWKAVVPLQNNPMLFRRRLFGRAVGGFLQTTLYSQGVWYTLREDFGIPLPLMVLLTIVAIAVTLGLTVLCITSIMLRLPSHTVIKTD
mmetsp:Transcript_41779/g.67773  ORF Transcript_41779/g.67773 Transcript_41779/m.67773 type:complete len:220 (+) Transcript_41779:81-740(+)